MATRFDHRVFIAAGTRDGLYVFESDLNRTSWEAYGPFLKGMDISHAILDPRDGRTVWAAANGEDHSAIYRSRDRGETWEIAGQPFDVEKIWHVEPATSHRPGTILAGTDPSTLFRSDNWGDTWYEVDGFRSQANRNEWWPGGGGMCLHTIVTNPARPDDLLVGMSVGGVFYSPDFGETWEPRNDGTVSMAEDFAMEMGKPVEHPGVHR